MLQSLNPSRVYDKTQIGADVCRHDILGWLRTGQGYLMYVMQAMAASVFLLRENKELPPF